MHTQRSFTIPLLCKEIELHCLTMFSYPQPQPLKGTDQSTCSKFKLRAPPALLCANWSVAISQHLFPFQTGWIPVTAGFGGPQKTTSHLNPMTCDASCHGAPCAIPANPTANLSLSTELDIGRSISGGRHVEISQGSSENKTPWQGYVTWQNT